MRGEGHSGASPEPKLHESNGQGNRHQWRAIILALACTVVAIIIAFAMIAILFFFATTTETTIHRDMSLDVSELLSEISLIKRYIKINSKPLVYFEATRNSNETLKDDSCWDLDKFIHEIVYGRIRIITFENIPVNLGGGMSHNGSFHAPVAGVYCFNVLGQVDPPDHRPARIYMVVYHSETWDDEHCKVAGDHVWPLCRTTTTRLKTADIFYGDKRKTHIGGTFVERLAAGDRVAIVQKGKKGFVYPPYGGSVLTFKGELVAASSTGY